MIDAVALSAAGVLPVRMQSVEAPAVAGASDAERFSAVLSGNDAANSVPIAASPDVAVASAPALGQTAIGRTTAPDAAVAPARTLGDAILQGLQSASNDITRAWASTGEVLNKPDITVSDMLRVQTMLLQSAVQYELVGKAVSKSTQSIENILKTQ